MPRLRGLRRTASEAAAVELAAYGLAQDTFSDQPLNILATTLAGASRRLSQIAERIAERLTSPPPRRRTPMTNPTLTRTSAPVSAVSDRFTLDRKQTVAFLARCRRRDRNLETAGPVAGETWTPEPGWDPRETDDLLDLENLIREATDAGAVCGPPGWDVSLLTMSEGSAAWYIWRLGYWDDNERSLGFTLAGESLEDLSIIGKWGTTGTCAALHVLAEAVGRANQVLDAYTRAGGRMVLPI